YNPGPASVDLSGWYLDDADCGSGSSVIGAQSIAASGFFVVNADDAGDNFALDNAGDVVVLCDDSDTEIDRVAYGDEGRAPIAPFAASASQYSIARVTDGTDTDDDARDFNIDPTPTSGASNDPPGVDLGSTVVINELDAFPVSGGDMVEIHNPTGSAVDISGWRISDGDDVAILNAFGAIPAGGFLALDEDSDWTTEGTTGVDFASTDVVYLFDDTGVRVDQLGYAGEFEDDCYARVPDGAGPNDAYNFTTQGGGVTLLDQACTLGATNGGGGGSTMAEIFEIQGDGITSPLVGTSVLTEDNIVTAVGTDGFFMQTPAARDDADPDTSNGIFVFTDTMPTVMAGDLVDVEGVVQEFFDHTQIAATSVTDVGDMALPAPIDLATAVSTDPTAPTCNLSGGGDIFEAAYECLESMYVTATGITTSGSQGFGSDPVAEPFVVTGTTRPFREPGIEFPGLPGLPIYDGNLQVFEVDPDKLGLLNVPVRALTNFTARGGLGFDFGQYEIWPSFWDFSGLPTLPVPVRARKPGEFTVGSLNMFRFFDDIDDPGVPDQVVPTLEYQTRRAKFTQYILEVLDAPDILGVQEVEKIGVLQDLATDIAVADPSVVYTAFLIEGNDVGGIDVGFLVRDTVTVDVTTQLGALETLTVDGSLLHDRPPLLIEARYTADGANFPLAVMVNHNRSLSGIDDPTDGARVRQKRLEQAQSIAQKIQDFQTLNPAVPFIQVGDNNAFQFTDSYVDVIGQTVGDITPADNLLSGPDLVDPNLRIEVDQISADERYSFIFDGSAQVLDHALTSTAAQPFVRGMEFGRGNADAPEIEIDNPMNPLYSSDHDGFVLYLMVDPIIFTDGFESGDTSMWSSTVP
ncbi:MAG: lamin tail domain-containing protein, partial [Acidobacteriota bacterium]